MTTWPVSATEMPETIHSSFNWLVTTPVKSTYSIRLMIIRDLVSSTRRSLNVCSSICLWVEVETKPNWVVSTERLRGYRASPGIDLAEASRIPLLLITKNTITRKIVTKGRKKCQ